MSLFSDSKPTKARSTSTREAVTRRRLREDLSGLDLSQDPNAPATIPMDRTEPSQAPKVETIVSPPVKPVEAVLVDEKDLPRRLAGLARSIRSHKKKAVSELLLCGKCLSEAQSLLADHNGGSFGKFITERCEMSRPTGYKLLKLWETFGGCKAAIQLGDADALRKLADGPSTAIVRATSMMDNGERVDMKVAKKLLEDAKPAKPKSEVHVQHIDLPGGGMIVIRTPTEVDPQRALMAALKSLRGDVAKAA